MEGERGWKGREGEGRRGGGGRGGRNSLQVHQVFSFLLLSSILCVSLLILASALDVPVLISSIITKNNKINTYGKVL